jgi:hypothetical protein
LPGITCAQSTTPVIPSISAEIRIFIALLTV